MPAWPAKDPDARKDYVYKVPLDDGDSVATHTFERLSGTVAIDSEQLAGSPTTDVDGYGQDLTAWLSGGADGEISVFRVYWTTAGGRSDDDIVTLPVVANEFTALTGYTKPSAAHLIARYPAFAAVPIGTIGAWLVEGESIVTESWAQSDYAPALMEFAAHSLTLQGFGATGAAQLPAGVTRFRSGAMDVSVSEAAANASVKGGYGSTSYGLAFQVRLRRNVGGMRLVSAGRALCGC